MPSVLNSQFMQPILLKPPPNVQRLWFAEFYVQNWNSHAHHEIDAFSGANQVKTMEFSHFLVLRRVLRCKLEFYQGLLLVTRVERVDAHPFCGLKSHQKHKRVNFRVLTICGGHEGLEVIFLACTVVSNALEPLFLLFGRLF